MENYEIWHTCNDGWGYMEVDITIHFKKELGYCMNENGSSSYTVKHELYLND